MLLELLLIAAIVALVYYFFDTSEGFAGAMIQLTAKGPQDSYLTVGTDKYVPEYYFPYREWLWNNSTRINYRYPYNYPYNYSRRYPYLYRYPYRYRYW